jgi:hypothetical protein
MIHPFFLPSVPINSRINLPTNPGVYFLIQWWKPWKILYIGKAANLRSRWSGKKHHKLKQAKRFGVQIHYKTTWSKSEAKDLEAIYQQRFKPPWNDRIESISFFRRFMRSIIGWMISIPISIALYYLLLIILAQFKNTPKFQVTESTNFRSHPNGKVICEVKAGTIVQSNLNPEKAKWLKTHLCNRDGVIHLSRLRRI